jgi:L-rhamnose mutarotase
MSACVTGAASLERQQQALRDTGWHNYSLFYRDDGFAVGFFESDATFAEACARMDKTEVNAKWQVCVCVCVCV